MTAQGAPSRLRVARVTRAHGVRGEVRVQPLGGGTERFKRGLRLTVEGDGRQVEVRSARSQGDSVLLLLAGIEDPEAAAALRDAYLTVDVEHARRLGPDEWFVWQLVGMHVRTPDGTPLGAVEDVEAGVASDVLVVRREGAVSRYPMVSAFVTAVDLEQRCITVQPWDEDP